MAGAHFSNLEAVSNSSSEFSRKFLKAVLSDAEEAQINSVCSPLSVHLALAAVHSGASGKTAEKLAEALFLPGDQETARNGFQELVANMLNAQFMALGAVELDVACKMLIHKDFEVKAKFRSALEETYGALAENVDLLADTTVSAVNKWVAKQTRGKITELLQPGCFDESSRVVLVSTVYFNGEWLWPFHKYFIQMGNFYVNENQTLHVPFMHHKENFNHARLEDLDAQIIEVPYKGEELSFVVVLPNRKSGLADLLERLDAQPLSELLDRMGNDRLIEIFLPRFTAESSLHLKKHLGELGLENIFSDAADLSEMATTPELLSKPLQVSEVVQRVFIEVNPRGTESATETFVDLSCAGRTHYALRVDCNRPFAFFVVYQRQCVLFGGTLFQPIPRGGFDF